ncbi:phosphotransferase [Micromonospora sp. NPDC050417]|uniref:phosphotransferase n=1 Tax=Micromonospora sp. NPDC050417 TaxID=3364280 RepID=UPI00378FA016
MSDGTLLASGRDADVFALDDARVLRRYRDGGDTASEAALMAYLSALGYPVPVVHAADGPDLVLERLDGATLLDALLTGAIDTEGAAELLAELHVRLHALPPRLGVDPADFDVAMTALIFAEVAVGEEIPLADALVQTRAD